MEAGGWTRHHCVPPSKSGTAHMWVMVYCPDGVRVWENRWSVVCHSQSLQAKPASSFSDSESASDPGYGWDMEGHEGPSCWCRTSISWRSIWWFRTKHQFINYKGLVHQAPRCWNSTNMLALFEISGQLNFMFLASQRDLERQVQFTERINGLYLPV